MLRATLHDIFLCVHLCTRRQQQVHTLRRAAEQSDTGSSWQLVTAMHSEVPDQCERNMSGFEHELRLPQPHTDHGAVHEETILRYCQLGETPCFPSTFFLFAYLIGLDIHVSDTDVFVQI
jgi:hypothetical protein